MPDSAKMDQSSDLAQYIRGTVYKNYKVNRDKIDMRWSRNRAAAEVDLELDEHGTWKNSENAESWQSDTMDDTIRQKIVAAKALVSDTAFKGGRVQFMLVPPDGAEQIGELGADRDAVVKDNENYIARQLDNCNAVGELSKCVLSGATYGRYFAKRYTTAMEFGNGFEQIAENIFVESVSDTSTMAFENKSVFNMYWDMEADDLIEGEAVIETDLVSPFMLRQDADKPYHLPKYIKKAIKSAKIKSDSGTSTDESKQLPTRLRDITNRSRNIHKIEFWGRVPRKTAEEFEKMIETDVDIQDSSYSADPEIAEDQGDMVEIFAILADDYVIAYHRTNDPKERPYFMGDWEEVLDGNCGRSIADNLFHIAKTLTGARRTLEDNMKLASSLILAMKRSMVVEDIEEEIGSDKAVKVLTLDEMDSRTSVRDAVQQLKIDSLIEPLSSIISTYLEFADLASSIPKAEQGQQSPNPQTAFELQQRLERSGKYMGEVIRRLDRFVEEIVNEFYRYNMLDPDMPVQKGVYRVKALGFSSFENRVLRLQKILQYFNMIIDRPEMLADVNLRWLHEEIAKAMDMDVAQLLKTLEQKQAEQQAQAEAAQNSPEAQALQAEMQLNIARAQSEEADALKSQHEIQMGEERLKIDRAKAIADIQQRARQTDKGNAT